jgi:pyruvate dehydrogenase E1 component beta subunit
VVLPATPRDAKGLLISAIEDDNPVIYLEHRWLHGIRDTVPDGHFRVPLGEARTVRPGKDVTIVATSYMVLEALRAAEMLSREGIDAEIIDPRTLRPLDEASILTSVARTGRLVVADTGWKLFGAAGEIIALACEQAFDRLKAAPSRVCLPDVPSPTAPALAAHYYPRAGHIVAAVLQQFGRKPDPALTAVPDGVHLDVPDPTFTGPF